MNDTPKEVAEPTSLTKWQQLAMPFYPSQLEWRVGQSGNKNGKNWAKLLCYKDARADMTRLDEVVGAANWSREHRCIETSKGIINICRVGIRLEAGGDWIYKEDGAEPTAIESVKGGLSDSFKRACVNFGIGRYLYDLGETMLFDNQIHKGYIPKGQHDALRIQIKGDSGFFWANYPQMDARFLPANYKPIRPPSDEPPEEPQTTSDAPPDQAPPQSTSKAPAASQAPPADSQQAPSEIPNPWRGLIAEVKVIKEGKSSRGPWSIKMITGTDGTTFTTFSDTFANNASLVEGINNEVVIGWVEKVKGNFTNREIESLTTAVKYDAGSKNDIPDPNEPPDEATHAIAAAAKANAHATAGIIDDDDIPF